MITLVDLADKLRLVDEISLLEMLEITSEDLVDRFMDTIEEKYEDLVEDFEESNPFKE